MRGYRYKKQVKKYLVSSYYDYFINLLLFHGLKNTYSCQQLAMTTDKTNHFNVQQINNNIIKYKYDIYKY